jgi:hypothetical protein
MALGWASVLSPDRDRLGLPSGPERGVMFSYRLHLEDGSDAG